MKKIIYTFIVSFSIFTLNSFAQNDTPKTVIVKDSTQLKQGGNQKEQEGGQNKLAKDSTTHSMVLKVYPKKDTSFRYSPLEEEIIVEVQNIQGLRNQSERSGKRIILYLDKEPVKDVYENNISENRISFFLKSSKSFAESLTNLRKSNSLDTGCMSLRVSVGFEGESPIPVLNNADNFSLVLISKWKKYLLIGLAIVLGIILIMFARKSNIVRDYDSIQLEDEKLWRPYSLALSQMAFWFYLVFYAAVYLYFGTGMPPQLPGSLLIMIGISTGTGLASTTINYDWLSNHRKKRKIFDDRKEKNKIELKRKGITEEEKKKAEEESEKLKQEALDNNYNNTLHISDGFFKDIFSDSTGVSLHRFQMAVWTLAIGIYFVIEIFRTLAMPDFSDSLLALMGISSGTYAGFKLTEKKNSV